MKVYSADLVIPITTPSVLDGAVAVEDGRIRHVGSRDWVLATLRDTGAEVEEIHWPGVIMPGLVNAHTHLQYTAMAEVGARRYGGFFDWVKAFNPVYQRGHDWAASAAQGAELSLRHGTTCAADVVTDLEAAAALHDAGLHGVAYWEVMDWANDEWSSCGPATVLSQLDHMPKHPGVGVSPHAPYSLETLPLLDLPDLARNRGLRLHLHLGEAAMEAEWAADAFEVLPDLWRTNPQSSFRRLRESGAGYSATQFVDQLGVLGPDCHIAHGVYMAADDRRRLRARSTAVALCARSNAVIGLAEPPVAAYLNEGNLIAVGTDSLASSPSLDVLAELPILYALARDQGYDKDDLSRRLLDAATLGGAHALGLAVGKRRVGQLQAGAVADIVVLDIPVSDIPHGHHDVVQHGAGRQVATLIGGQVRWADERFGR